VSSSLLVMATCVLLTVFPPPFISCFTWTWVDFILAFLLLLTRLSIPSIDCKWSVWLENETENIQYEQKWSFNALYPSTQVGVASRHPSGSLWKYLSYKRPSLLSMSRSCSSISFTPSIQLRLFKNKCLLITHN
jgi:hypothetical protein